MKNNKFMRIAMVLLVAVIVSTCAISGTFAKYASDATGTANGTTATWSFKVGDADIAKTDTTTFTFDLFKTIVDTVDGQTDAEVATGKMAPGTKGNFEIVLTNASEVDAKYEIDFSYTAGPALQFSTDGSNWKNSIDELDITGEKAVQLDYTGGATTTDTVTIYWQWVFGENVDDNSFAGTTITVTAAVTATQVD